MPSGFVDRPTTWSGEIFLALDEMRNGAEEPEGTLDRGGGWRTTKRRRLEA